MGCNCLNEAVRTQMIWGQMHHDATIIITPYTSTYHANVSLSFIIIHYHSLSFIIITI